MSASFVDLVAQAIHDGWWAAKREAGWELGPRDRAEKTHPHMLPWSECGLENNNQDRFVAALVIHYLRACESEDPPHDPTEEELAARIHNAWAECMTVEGHTDHPHIGDTWHDHDEEGRAEHLTQAAYVRRVWEHRPSGATE